MYKVTLKDKAVCGKIEIPRGDYAVSLHAETQQINFAGGGKDYKVAATKRRSQGKTKITSFSFYNSGGKHWSVVFSTPHSGEFIAVLEYGKQLGKA